VGSLSLASLNPLDFREGNELDGVKDLQRGCCKMEIEL
jgi:hypothetical protein